MDKGYVVLLRGWTEGEAVEALRYAVTPLGANLAPVAATQALKVMR